MGRAAKKIEDENDEPRTGPADQIDETPEKDPEIDLDDDDDDEPIDQTPKSPTRDEKRRNRYRENIERAERAERDATEARVREANALEQVRQTMAWAQRQAQPAQPQRDPIDDAEAQLVRERQLLYAQHEQRLGTAAKNPLSQAEKDEFERRAIELENRHVDLRVQRYDRQRGPQGNPAAEALKVQLTMQYPEVVADQRALAHANGLQMIAASEGKQPWAMETIREVMDATERKFRLGKYKSQRAAEPDPILRDRYQAPTRGATNGASKGDRRTFTMTKEMRKMADAAYKHIKDPNQRYRMFAKAQVEDDE